MEVVVVADTHLRAGLASLPRRLLDAVGRADAVIHAGDVVSRQALAELQALAPLHGVRGNNDHDLAGLVPEQLVLDLAGVRLAVVHDAGPAHGRAARLGRRFPDARVVVFGHSHTPVDEEGVDGQRLFNPGSPTQRRAQPLPTFGRLVLRHGRVVDHVIEALDRPGAQPAAGAGTR